VRPIRSAVSSRPWMACTVRDEFHECNDAATGKRDSPSARPSRIRGLRGRFIAVLQARRLSRVVSLLVFYVFERPKFSPAFWTFGPTRFRLSRKTKRIAHPNSVRAALFDLPTVLPRGFGRSARYFHSYGWSVKENRWQFPSPPPPRSYVFDNKI